MIMEMVMTMMEMTMMTMMIEIESLSRFREQAHRIREVLKEKVSHDDEEDKEEEDDEKKG